MEAITKFYKAFPIEKQKAKDIIIRLKKSLGEAEYSKDSTALVWNFVGGKVRVLLYHGESSPKKVAVYDRKYLLTVQNAIKNT